MAEVELKRLIEERKLIRKISSFIFWATALLAITYSAATIFLAVRILFGGE